MNKDEYERGISLQIDWLIIVLALIVGIIGGGITFDLMHINLYAQVKILKETCKIVDIK